MSSNTLEIQIIRLGEKHSVADLNKLIANTSAKTLTNVLSSVLGRNDFTTFWNYLLLGFDEENADKRFACVKCFLDGLLKVELTYKQTYDLITRLCQDLHTFPSEQVIEILEHCIDDLRLGDPKCVGWKDLLPEALKALEDMSELSVNGVQMASTDFRNDTVRNLYTMRWPTEVLTPIADMFRNIELRPAETAIILNKFAGSLQSLAPTELPALAFQLFSICSNASQIITLLLALEKYFYRYYYRQLYADMNSNSTDLDTIDKFSDQELREAEETILHHLNYCTQYKISELQIAVVLKNFQHMPDVILTPFMLSAMLSMTKANREPDTCLMTSVLLPFLRSIIRHNEEERILAECSIWCRDSLQRKQVDLEQIFTVLIDQNKDGKDSITPGLVNLVFVLLKARNNKELHTLATNFMTKFIRKRFVFGKGIVKKLAEWMVLEQEQYQFSDCLTALSVVDTFTVSECLKTIEYVFDYFLWIPGEQAMRMMSFILPVLKISPKVRDAFIEVLRKGFNSSLVKTRHMSVFGFCMILKQLNNSNAQRSQGGAASMCTQHSISGFSLMSQSTFGARSNPQRHFDMLTLEIIGVLRSCFNDNLEIKVTLYENLQRAVELNPKLVPHVLQFIDWHFRSFFKKQDTLEGDSEFIVQFEKIVHSTDSQDSVIEVRDNLGRLILCVSHCLELFENCEQDYDSREMKSLLRTSLEKTVSRSLKFEDLNGTLTPLKMELIGQQLNFIEGIMGYVVLTSTQFNDNVKQLLPLFKEHRRVVEGLKAMSIKKGTKKTKNSDETSCSQANVTINGVPMKKINTKVENIWDLVVMERLLRLLHEDIVPFASQSNVALLRSNTSLVCYVFEVVAEKIKDIRLEPEYKQLSHSKRVLKFLTDITKVIYERCIKRLPDLWNNFDLKAAVLAAECFQQCLFTANQTFQKHFVETYVKGFDLYALHSCKEAPMVMQEIIEVYMKEHVSAEKDDEIKDDLRIPQSLLMGLEVLYDNMSYGNRITTESYMWLLQFCKVYALESKELFIIHKLLFVQRQKTHSGAFFNNIAQHLGNVLGFVHDEEQNGDTKTYDLKSITKKSAESCFTYLHVSLRKQIEDVDYFIMKASNLNYKCRIVCDDERDLCFSMLRSLERSICSQLVHISNTLLDLTNVCLPLGACMDSLLRVLIMYYDSLKNLAKHLMASVSSSKTSITETRFDLLLKIIGKKLPTNIYNLISYIEANILEKSKKKVKPEDERSKVLRETKLIPKIILHMENFNKHVVMLAKKTNERLANFLHSGTVRDFRIQTADLKAAIERTLSHSNEIEVVPSSMGDENQEINDNEDETLLEQLELESNSLESNEKADDNESVVTSVDNDENDENVINAAEKVNKQKKEISNSTKSKEASKSTKSKEISKSTKLKNTSKSTKSKEILKSKEPKKPVGRRRVVIDDVDDTPTTTPEDALENESEMQTGTQLLMNLKKINKKAKKRTLRELEDNDPDVRSATPPEPKRRRGRSAKI